MSGNSIFRGCIPALMTPCSRDGVPNFDALVKTARPLIAEPLVGREFVMKRRGKDASGSLENSELEQQWRLLGS